jgi:hypothetical protein
VLVVLLVVPVGDRTGDGCEYYAMLFSWIHGKRPWANPQIFQIYDQHASEHTGYATGENLKSVVIKLAREDQTQDFLHFWFYSGMVATFNWIPQLLGVDVGISFTLLHLTLLILVSIQIQRRFGELGLLSFLLIVLFSPTLWFINKPQTEFFTFCLTVSGLVYFACSEFALACLSFSILSTQNPPFAAVSLSAACCQLFKSGFGGLTIRDIILLVLAAVFCVIHPVYYLLRHDILSPLIAVYGATFKVPNWKEMTAWCIDPDIGLLLNWPLGVLILVAFGISSWSFVTKKSVTFPWRFIFFCFLYLVILSFSQAMAANVNSGGTVSVTRYAMWYLCFFVFFLYSILLWQKSKPQKYTIIFILLFLTLAVLSVEKYFPSRPDTYLKPTAASRFLYRYLPNLYDPIPEIYIERNTGQERGCYDGIFSNQYCNKILAFRNAVDGLEQNAVIRPTGCQKPGEIHGLSKPMKLFFASKPHLNYAYFSISNDLLPPFVSDGDKLNFAESSIERFLGQGWGASESWGRWTDGHRSEFWFCLNDLLKDHDIVLTITAKKWFFQPKTQSTTVNVILNGKHIQSFHMDLGSILSTKVLLRAEWLSKQNCLIFEIPYDASTPASQSFGKGEKCKFGCISLQFDSIHTKRQNRNAGPSHRFRAN